MMAINRRFTRSDAWLTLFGAGFLVLAGLLSGTPVAEVAAKVGALLFGSFVLVRGMIR